MIMKKLSLYSMLFIALPLAASCDLKGWKSHTNLTHPVKVF